jgi:hypothetical protein
MRAHEQSVTIAASKSTTQQILKRALLEFHGVETETLMSPQNSPPNKSAVAEAGCIGASPRVQELMRRFAHHAYCGVVGKHVTGGSGRRAFRLCLR